jgi:cytochrome c biogenesis protein CcmG/thiol:disulfide interchange protein DsbE
MQNDSINPISQETKNKSGQSWGFILAAAGVIAGLVALLVIVATLVIVGLILAKRQQGPVRIGAMAPDFTLTSFDGQTYTLSDLAGKVVLVNFWASWCKPCEQEAADMEAAWRYYQTRGDVVFLGVDWTDTEPKAKAYLEKFDITYPNGPDLGTRISQKFRTTGVPETYIVGRDGRLAFVKLSPFLSVEEITGAIDQALEK